jgi:hypothetical protein
MQIRIRVLNCDSCGIMTLMFIVSNKAISSALDRRKVKNIIILVISAYFNAYGHRMLAAPCTFNSVM